MDRGRKGKREVVDKDEEEEGSKHRALGNTEPKTKRPALGVPEGDRGTPVRQESLDPTNKARGEPDEEELLKESGMPDRVEGFGEVDGG